MEKYIQPFIDVCVAVFKDFIGCDLIPGCPYFINTKNPPGGDAAEGDAAGKDAAESWDISGIIGLTGEARGAVVISMKKELAGKITAMLTGLEGPVPDNEITDAVGELINIIAGNAKRGLEQSFRLVISLPTIAEGKGHSIRWPGDQTRIICIPFTLLGNQKFCLSVAIEAVTGDA